MDIKLLKTDILSNNIPNFLIFEIYEYALAKQYIEYISNTINKSIKFYYSAKEVIYDIETNLKEDYLYIIYNDKNVTNDGYIVEKLILSNKNIIVCFEQINGSHQFPFIDKKSDFYKKYKNYIVTFKKLDNYTLLAYAEKLCKNNKCSIEQEKLIKLIEYCNNDLNILLNELNKIFILGQENSNILTQYLLDEGFIDYRETNIFDFINLILNKDKRAFEYNLRINESPVNILINLFNMSKKRLISSRNLVYKDIMKLSYKLYCGILDGSLDSSYVINYLLLRLFE